MVLRSICKRAMKKNQKNNTICCFNSPIIICYLLALNVLLASEQEFVNVGFNSSVGDALTRFEMPFKNAKDYSQRISRIDGGCGCFTFEIVDREILPGESIIISGIYSFGTDVGPQNRIIEIDSTSTSDPDIINVSAVKLSGNILSPISVNPPSILWRPGEGTKRIDVSAVGSYEIADVSLELIGSSGEAMIIDKYIEESTSRTNVYMIKRELIDGQLGKDATKGKAFIKYSFNKNGQEVKRTERLDIKILSEPK